MTDYVTKDGRHVTVAKPLLAKDTTLAAPTAEFLRDLWREDVDEETWAKWDEPLEIDIKPDDHGHQGTIVFHRKVDDTYWGVNFLSQSGGDYHSFRDGDEDLVYRLWPVKRVVTEYVTKDPNA